MASMERSPLSGLRDVGNFGGPFPGRPGTPNAFAATAAPLPQPQVSPFNAVLDPSRSGILGLLGRLSGNPTREEHQAQEIGAARGVGLQKLQQSIAQGNPPQQAIMDFVNTPEGMDFIMKDPDPMGTIQGFLKNTAGPEPEPAQVLSAGQSLVRPGPEGAEVLHSIPTTETMEFTELAELGQLSPEETAAVARAQLMAKQAGDPTQAEAAIARLVEKDIISPETGDKMLAGALTVTPIIGKHGETVGHTLFDSTSGRAHMLDETPPAPSAEAPIPGLEDPAKPQQLPGEALSQLENPADIVEGVGMMGAFREIGGGIAGQFSPSLSGHEASIQRNALRQITLDANRIRDRSKISAAEVQKIENVVNRLSWRSNPIQATQALIDWTQYLEGHLADAKIRESDMSTSETVRGEAAQEIAGIEGAMANLPPLDALQAKLEELKSGPGAMIDAMSEGFGAAETLEKDVLGGEEAPAAAPKKADKAKPNQARKTQPNRPASRSFKDAAAVEEAVRSGALQIGDTFMMGGEEYVATE